ncbi:MAG TPA: hypothetical protein DGT21_00055 [Armatimonadetes bacterium]|nr:hypothetical protein [Armatimonadota bacterium]
MSTLAVNGGEPVRTEGPTAMWPVCGDREKELLCDIIDTGKFLYGGGEHGVAFERELAEWMGCSYALGTVNGTETMVLALKAAGIGPGDEVIMPAMTFIACPLSVLLAQAVPVLADIAYADMALDPAAVEAKITENTRAIMAVSLYGVPCDLDAMVDICERHSLLLLEDVAQAQGCEWRGKKLGTIGHIGSLSFHTAKIITSGDGGAIVTDDKELHDFCRSYRQFGLPFEGSEHDCAVTGGNYRMSEFVAAVLRAQMERIDELIDKRNESAAILDEMLQGLDVVRPFEFHPQVTRRSYLNYAMAYDQQAAGGVHRDVFRQALAAEGCPAAIGYPYVLNELPLLAGPLRERDKGRFFGRRIDYAAESYPVARDLVDNVMMNYSQHWLLSDPETVRDIGRAVQKVVDGIDTLRDREPA